MTTALARSLALGAGIEQMGTRSPMAEKRAETQALEDDSSEHGMRPDSSSMSKFAENGRLSVLENYAAGPAPPAMCPLSDLSPSKK